MLVKSTLSAIPVHTSIALCLSSWAIECIDKLHRAFIWCGAASVPGERCKVAWEIVCRPRDLGGLGVADLRWTGVALRVRWPWLRRVDQERTWRALPDCLAHDNFGKPARRRVSNSSSGLLCMEDARRHIGDGVMDFKKVTLASSVTKRWKQWITSSLAASSAGKCGHHV